jgi:hypothetical protein
MASGYMHCVPPPTEEDDFPVLEVYLSRSNGGGQN